MAADFECLKIFDDVLMPVQLLKDFPLVFQPVVVIRRRRHFEDQLLPAPFDQQRHGAGPRTEAAS